MNVSISALVVDLNTSVVGIQSAISLYALKRIRAFQASMIFLVFVALVVASGECDQWPMAPGGDCGHWGGIP